MKTVIPWIIVGVLALALVVLLLGAGGSSDVPAGQAANARCSGLIVSNSCNVHMEQMQPEKPKQGLNLLDAAAGFLLVAVATFCAGAWLARAQMSSELENAFSR
jgi:hypothetical protein